MPTASKGLHGLGAHQCRQVSRWQGVPQDGYVHCVAGDACNKPSSYAGVAKATRDLEQHTDTYLDRSGLEGAVQQLHDTLYCNMRTAEQFVYYLLAWHAACDMLHLSNDFACQFQVPYPGGAAHHNVHELGLQHERMGQSDKDTRAASNAIKAKLRTARQLLKEAALYQVLGSGEDAAAVSIIEEQLQAMHMIVVCKGACGELEAHGEAESGQLQQSLHIGRLFYIKQHMQQYQDMLIKAEGMHMS
ncbi:hypothetical protein QJQ45_010657 [Haematococcus lacustris]|nr:hypothetical protein QJQ45_010657 [Haematococcus lacustris]